MDINRKLDIILKFLSDKYEQSTQIRETSADGITYKDWVIGTEWTDDTELATHYVFKTMDRYDFNFLIEYLASKEHLVFKQENLQRNYKITFAGRFFIQNGGYTAAHEKENADKNFIKIMTIQSERNSRKLNFITFILFIATIIPVVIMMTDKLQLSWFSLKTSQFIFSMLLGCLISGSIGFFVLAYYNNKEIDKLMSSHLPKANK